jgi:hypothetical protein
MKSGALLILVSCAACSTGPETSSVLTETEYRRADARLRMTEEFEIRKEACARAGGTMSVKTGTNARQPPRPRDLRRATCERVSGFRGDY